MMTEPKSVNILGTKIQILFRKEKDDPKLEEANGYFDATKDLIVVKIIEPDKMSMGDLGKYQKKVLRHEIIHAFLHGSGLDWCSCGTDRWANNEEMVDWFAIQSTKILKVFQELGVA